nr:hypothetical protein [Elizabethkingia bruuniana]
MKKIIVLISLSILFTNFLSAQKPVEQETEINQINELMTKSYERGLFNGNVLVAKKEKSSIKNHLALPMKQEKRL